MSVINKSCVISFANKNGNYAQMLARLSDSLRNNAPGIDFIAWTHEAALGAPLHSENPYAFKVYALEHAIKAGYENILWLDSSAYAVGNIQPIFDIIEREGYFFHPDGNYLGNWSNDKLLEQFEITRDTAMKIPLVKGGMFGLQRDCTAVKSLLAVSCVEGLFKGKWNNDQLTESRDRRCRGHRHEMSVLSAIVHQLGLTIQDGNSLIETGGPYDAIRGANIVIKYQGI
jgi:hypothetical protein